MTPMTKILLFLVLAALVVVPLVSALAVSQP
jgi:hypothetical protein